MPSPPTPEFNAATLEERHGQAESSEVDHADHGGLSIPRNDLFLRAARGERTERTPVWLMRQAGRFDPQYQRLRATCDFELEELFRTPELAAQITMLPVRLGVDAAILFQDILTPLSPMGAHFTFRPGPVLEEPIRTAHQIDALTLYDPLDALNFVPQSIELALSRLDDAIPLIGFAGAPLTLATFLIEGGSPGRDAGRVRAFLRDDPEACHRLLEKLADMTVRYLRMQVESGAHAIQLFESVGDLFAEDVYERFAHPYQMRIMNELKGLCPRILFVKENPHLKLMIRTGADVISVGKCVNLRKARHDLKGSIALQGNVDNELLRHGTTEQIRYAVQECIEAGGHHGHILNLNHGILKDTPIENVRQFIDVAKSIRLGPDNCTVKKTP